MELLTLDMMNVCVCSKVKSVKQMWEETENRERKENLVTMVHSSMITLMINVRICYLSEF